MKMEDHFKETLHRAVANEPPVLEAWDRFERRLGRARRRRYAAALAGAAAVIAAAVVVVPKLGTGGVELLPPLTPKPSWAYPSPTVSPTSDDPYADAGWSGFGDSEYHYMMRHPMHWELSTFEGEPEVRPPGLPGLAAGSAETFGVAWVVLTPDVRAAPEGPIQVRPDAREFVRTEDVYDEERSPAEGGPVQIRRIIYAIDWSESACGIKLGACSEGEARTLFVSIIGEDTADFFGRFGSIGELIVQSFRYGL